MVSVHSGFAEILQHNHKLKLYGTRQLINNYYDDDDDDYYYYSTE